MWTDDMPRVTASEAELEAATQENLYALFRTMVRHLDGELLETAVLSRHHTRPASPMFRGVWHTRLAADSADAAIEDTIAWFHARGAPDFFWWMAPGDTPDDLPERLRAHGLLDLGGRIQPSSEDEGPESSGSPCMVADLNHLNENLLEAVPPGFEIRDVSSPEILSDFGRAFQESFNTSEAAAHAWAGATAHRGFGQMPWLSVVGYLEGEPVATNMLLCGGGVAGLYAVGTVPAARGKGIGAATTLHLLLEARTRGYRYGVLFSSPMGLPVYERIGFRRVNARLRRFLWQNPSTGG